MTDLSE